jgi:arylformamidase
MPASPDRRVFDVSRPLAAGTACWPGDTPFSFRFAWKIADGASVNVGTVQSSVHTATHCDAPFHFDDNRPTVDQIPVETFAGQCWVVDVRGTQRWQSRMEELDFTDTPRVLFRTGGWPDSTRFPNGIPVMEPDLPALLAEQGVILIGVDVPSVDELDSKTLDNHHALGRAGITIVEGLWLDGVPAGRYEFVGLPLKIVGADGSPLRAVLVEER